MAPRPLAGKDWPRIRHDYERTDKPIHEICAEHGIGTSTLRNRARQWGWTLRRAPVPAEGPPLPRVKAAPLAPAPAPVAPAQAARYAAAAALLAASPAAHDPALIAARLQGAMARVLAAIEIAFAQLLSAPAQPREIERAARALAPLTRTLRELNAMLGQYPALQRDENDAEVCAELQKLERMALVNEAFRRGILDDS